MWCCGRMEKISWTDRVANAVLHRVKEKRNILHTVKRGKAGRQDWSHRALELSSEARYIREGGRKEVMGQRGRRRKQLLYELKYKRRYCKLKAEAIDLSVGQHIYVRIRTALRFCMHFVYI
jgi:hypothetical protein